jgi:hypothetical protein
MNAKNPKFAIAPEGCCNYLTAGKKYEILKFNEEFFSIIDEEGTKLHYCIINGGCSHLNGKNWILRNK